MSIFNDVKAAVTMPELVRAYGFSPNRAGFIPCPFHVERTASMKIYQNSFHCFGCGATGSVIDFVMQLYNLDPLEAARRINDDMGLNLSLDHKPDEREREQLKKDRAAQERFAAFVEAYKAELCAIVYLANRADGRIASLDDLNNSEALAIYNREKLIYILDLLNSEDIDDKIFAVGDRREVQRLCRTICGG